MATIFQKNTGEEIVHADQHARFPRAVPKKSKTLQRAVIITRL